MTNDFTVVLRGYDRAQVDTLLTGVDEALAAGNEPAARALLTSAGMTVRLRGYDRRQVDRELDARRQRVSGRPAAPEPGVPDFTIVLRGYEIPEVERVLTLAAEAITSGSETQRAAAREVLRSADFAVVLRGYDRGQVDREIERRLQRL